MMFLAAASSASFHITRIDFYLAICVVVFFIAVRTIIRDGPWVRMPKPDNNDGHPRRGRHDGTRSGVNSPHGPRNGMRSGQ